MRDMIMGSPSGVVPKKPKPRADIQSWNCIPKQGGDELTDDFDGI